jgi:hypothetical protein
MIGSPTYSVLQGAEKKCYQTGRTDHLDKHHVFPGVGKRKISDKYGFWVWLTKEWHNGDSRICVHSHPNTGLDLQLKQECQQHFELDNIREAWIALIGRSYL